MKLGISGQALGEVMSFADIVKLGKKYGVPTPRLDLMVEAYRYLLGEGAPLEGPDFALDFSQLP